MHEGWVMIHRKIKSNWLFIEKRVFSDFEAWIDLILSVNHCDNIFKFGESRVRVKRGSMITSIRGLSGRWKWSNTKVKNFLKLLQKEKMITYKSDSKKTILSIVNYSIYQEGNITKNDAGASLENHRSDTETSLEHTNNNDNNEKNDKNEKKKYAQFVSMTAGEYEKLCAAYGTDMVLRMIEVLDNYKGSSGKKYKSDYRAILCWVADRVLNERSKVITMPNAGAYREESQKCPICRDSGWVLDENKDMVRCSCQEVRANG